jgi:hypothetical protein
VATPEATRFSKILIPCPQSFATLSGDQGGQANKDIATTLNVSKSVVKNVLQQPFS